MLPYHGLIPDFFFFNDTATTEIYTLSLHDALPIFRDRRDRDRRRRRRRARRHERAHRALHRGRRPLRPGPDLRGRTRSEEHTSELQSRLHLVCRLLLEKKKQRPHSLINYSPTTELA